MPLEFPFVYQLFPDGRGRWVANQAVSYVQSQPQEAIPEVGKKVSPPPLFEGISFAQNLLGRLVITEA